jgi:hypothetical protein
MILYVKKTTDPDFSKVLVPIDGDLCDLKELIKAKLQISDPSTAMVLRKRQKNGRLGRPLNSTKTVEEARLKEKQQLLVDVSPSAQSTAG